MHCLILKISRLSCIGMKKSVNCLLPRDYTAIESKCSPVILSEISIELGIDRSNKLRDLTTEQDLRAWTQHLSLYNIFATILFAYVHRISGQQKLAIGTPAHNRPTAVFKETPGVFIELFPLISEVEDHLGFDTLFQLVSDEVNGFLRHAIPGATSAELNRGFQVILNYIHASFSDFHGIPMSSKWVHPGHCDPRHHLRLQVHDFDASGNIQLHFDLNTQVFDEVNRTVVPQHFLKLLDAFIEDRSQAIGKPMLLTGHEYQHLTQQEVDSSALGESSSILDLFASQMIRTADAPAIIFGDQVMSYQDLESQVKSTCKLPGTRWD